MRRRYGKNRRKTFNRRRRRGRAGRRRTPTIMVYRGGIRK